MHQELAATLAHAETNTLVFQDVMAMIRRHYECTPVAFSTGRDTERQVDNAAGANAASCLLLSFARRLGLDMATTLALYGEHYRDVLADPQGKSHANIRALLTNGWAGVTFAGDPLRLRGPA